MIWRKIMNNKDQENEVWRGPLIFTVPAYGFVMALYLDWLGSSNREAVSGKTHGWNWLATRPRTVKDSPDRVMNEGGQTG
jgi:hypothetical protein